MNIKVNGRDVQVQEGVNLLTALLDAGYDIPNLCYLPEIEAYGGCGLCLVEVAGMNKPVRACTTQPTEGMEIQTDSERVVASRQMTLGMLLSDHRGDCRPPCHLACPANQDCQAYIGMMADGQFDEAFRRIMEDNPLPGSIGRVCPHPCEDACRRKLLEGPLSLMQLKRFAEEMAGASFVPRVEPKTGKKVAVVGAGPAGLTAAYFLARKGHAVEIFEMMPAPGGMLRYGIPSYRLDKAVVDREVARITDLGVQIHYGTKLGKDITLDTLQAQYDAVFVGVGAWAASSLGCPGDTLPGVLGGIDFLEQVALGNAPDIGKRVAVVGGGNTAMDAVRTSIRLGAEVHLIYRRTRAEMPAEDLEIEEAEEEGAIFNFLVTPETVLEEGGRAVGLRLSQMRLGEPDASGRRRPEATGEHKDMAFDTIIAAIGQKVVPDGIESLAKTRWNTIIADPGTFETNIPGVFAGGDAVNDGPGIAIAAIGHGKTAAQTIDSYLRGNLTPVHKPFYVEQKDITAAADIPETPAVERVRVATEAPQARIGHFREFTQTLTPQQAMQEAQRCLECGCCDLYDCHLLPLLQQYDAASAHVTGRARKQAPDRSHPAIWRDANKCVLCGLCVRACDKLVDATALGFDGRGFDTAAEPAFGWPMAHSDCISCGYCVQICPTGALQERRPYEKTPPLPMEVEVVTCTFCPRGCQYELQRYGERVLKAIPVKRAENCSIGRFAPVILNEQCGSFSADQRGTLRKVLLGDLNAFVGQVPERIGDIVLV